MAKSPEPEFKFKPHLPNSDSAHKTAASLTFDLHYAQLGLVQRWDWQRYCRLAAFLELTVYELGSLLCITHRRVISRKSGSRFLPTECLLLTMLEAQAMKSYGADVIENPLPKLQ